MRRCLAVDGHGMFYAQQKLGWFFDPRRLLELASEGVSDLGSAFWYTGLKDPTDQRPFRDALTSLGFTVRTKPLREFGTDPDQRQFARANLDVELCLDLMAVAHRTDELWLMSGSRDLERLVEMLRAQGLKITLINADGMVPRELRNAVDRFIDLGKLKAQLEKMEAVQAPVFQRSAPEALPRPEPVRHQVIRPEAASFEHSPREVVIGPSV
ncbi:NYN domain-containing protein [Synechococcus sp. ATX 2A4]|uniref:LabA-like NYN domain-containing protein n=1 Tax=Synechococcus sp. ATX 2A4 TaxID=2823727 RepID=UPI0028F40AE2|nr:NYN domain-containing protein [Synechococcus sp. ATX 2A4]MCP9884417.1 NYN domain-containing protein [Synechococcus sp. ATX 2A4]